MNFLSMFVHTLVATILLQQNEAYELRTAINQASHHILVRACETIRKTPRNHPCCSASSSLKTNRRANTCILHQPV